MKPLKRKSAEPLETRRVKCTVVLDANTHAKLAALAALRGCDRSTIAADAIRAAVSSVVVFDRAERRKPDPATPDDEGIGAEVAA